MRRTICSAAFAMVAALGLFAASQPLSAQDQERQPLDDRTTACNRVDNFGAGATQFNVCLSNEGNVTEIDAPAGFSQADLPEEGYQLCTVGADYRDFGALGNNGWLAASVVQPTPGSIVGLVVTRKTTDNQWQLKQTFGKSNAKREITITMALKKLNSPIGGPVYLERWNGFNLDNDFLSGSIHDQTANSVTGRRIRGLSLTALTFGTTHFNAVGTNFNFGAQPGVCNAVSAASPTAFVDGAGYVTYSLPGFNTGETRTVKFAYRVY